MFEFFRRYQKVVFIAVTAALAISFCFFGAYGALEGSQKKEKDVSLGVSIDGSAMSKREIDKMVRFLASDHRDFELMVSGKSPNIFNDGVIRNDLVATGIAEMLVSNYFEKIAPDLESRIARAKGYRPYRHPQTEAVSAENMWRQFVPEMSEKVAAVRSCSDAEEAFHALSGAYLAQSQFPSHLLRRFLSYQQNQLQGLQKDPAIERGDLSLFRFHSLEDWFGENFVRLSCQFIHNMSLHAKSSGHKVSFEEARADLLRIGMATLKEQMGDDVSQDLLAKAWKEQLFLAGVDDKSAVEVWQKVLLFRRTFDAVGSSAILDRMTYDHYHNFAAATCDVEAYRLPEELELGSMRDLYLFQKYVDLVAGASGIEIPKKKLPVSQIEKRAPELLVKEYKVAVSRVSLDEISLETGLREMWDWQSENWAVLQKKFRQLEKQAGEDSLEALDKLAPELRARVDAFSREQICLADPTWYMEALLNAEPQEIEMALPMRGETSQLPGIENARTLAKELDAKEKVYGYTQDQKNYYHITVLEKQETPRLCSFAEAKNSGALEVALTKEIETVYPTIRVAHPTLFLQSESQWKPLAEVRDEVARLHYADVLKAIEKEHRKRGGTLKGPSLKETDQFYLANRFRATVEKGVEAVRMGTDVAADEAMWKLSAANETVRRSEAKALELAQIFELEEGQVTDVMQVRGGLQFCKLVKRYESDAKSVVGHISNGQKLLGNEAKRDFMMDMLDTIKEKECIHLEGPAA